MIHNKRSNYLWTGRTKDKKDIADLAIHKRTNRIIRGKIRKEENKTKQKDERSAKDVTTVPMKPHAIILNSVPTLNHIMAQWPSPVLP